MENRFFKTLETNLSKNLKIRVVIPMAADEGIIFAIKKCLSNDFIGAATLIGNSLKIKKILKNYTEDPRIKIIEADTESQALSIAFNEIKNTRTDLLMKGMISSYVFLKALQNSKLYNNFLSHIACFQLPDKNDFQILTDSFVNTTESEDILFKEIENALNIFKALSNAETPKVALLAANEKVSEKVPSTKYAESLAIKFKENSDIIVEGPISFDLAVSPKSAKIKKYKGKINGDANIFIAPRIETANALYNSLQHILHVEMGGLVCGDISPIVYPSSKDNSESKYNSLILGLALLNN